MNPGQDAVLLGTIGIEGNVFKYQIIKRTNQNSPFTATTNAQGELWVLVGTDSGFEGFTKLYYTKINVNLIFNCFAPLYFISIGELFVFFQIEKCRKLSVLLSEKMLINIEKYNLLY